MASQGFVTVKTIPAPQAWNIYLYNFAYDDDDDGDDCGGDGGDDEYVQVQQPQLPVL